MNTKNKLIYSMLSLCMVLLVVGIAVTAVLAANTQAVRNKVKISYIADNVAAQVQASYLTWDASTETYFVTESSANQITFDPTAQTTKTETLTASDFNLNFYGNGAFVIFIYRFRNLNAVGGGNLPLGRNLVVALSADNADKENVKCYYLASNSELTGTSSARRTSIMNSPNRKTSSQSISFQVAPQQTGYFYCLVEVDDAGTESNYSAVEGSCLTWSLSTAAQ